MKETLISVPKLLEVNFEIFFRLPHHCLTDGFEPTKYPFYGGFLLLPPVTPSHDRQMIILHYVTNTWCLPTLPLLDSVDLFLRPLTTVPDSTLQDTDVSDNWDQEDVSLFSEKELKSLTIQVAHKVTVKR